MYKLGILFCRQHRDDPMVLHREEYIAEAFQEELNQVPKEVVKGWNFANADQMLTLLQSVISQVFQLPGQGAKEGSAEWVDAVFRTDRYTFEDLITHKKLLNQYFKKFAGDLTNDGQLPLYPGETVPDRDYTRSRSYEYLPSANRSVSYTKHPHMPFLRRVHVQKAINELRNMGLYAFKTSPSSVPDGRGSVDNFAQFKTVFHIWYCYFEGWKP